MSESETGQNHGPVRYRWPWYVLAALVLTVALAVTAVWREARRVQEIRRENLSSPTGEGGRWGGEK